MILLPCNVRKDTRLYIFRRRRKWHQIKLFAWAFYLISFPLVSVFSFVCQLGGVSERARSKYFSSHLKFINFWQAFDSYPWTWQLLTQLHMFIALNFRLMQSVDITRKVQNAQLYCERISYNIWTAMVRSQMPRIIESIKKNGDSKLSTRNYRRDSSFKWELLK